MRTRHLMVALVAAAATTLAAANADADWASIRIQKQHPAVACDHTPGLSIYAGSLRNWSDSVQYVSCPLTRDVEASNIYFIAAFSIGPRDGVTCWIANGDRAGGYSQTFALSRTYESGYEQQVLWQNPWSFLTTVGRERSVAVECSIPHGAGFTGYYVDDLWLSPWQDGF
jgi:hypothetical protein